MKTTLRDLTTIENLLYDDSGVGFEVRKDIKAYRIYYYRDYNNDSSDDDDTKTLNIKRLLIDTDLIRLNINDVFFDTINEINDYLSGINANEITNINDDLKKQIKDFINSFSVNEEAAGFEIILPYNEESYSVNDIKIIYEYVVKILRIENPVYGTNWTFSNN